MKRILLTLFCCVVWAMPSFAAIAYVQSVGNFSTSSGTSLAGDFSSTPTNGNLIIVAARIGAAGRTVTVSDDGLNTYAIAITESDGSSDLITFYAMNIAGVASHTVTVSISGAGTSIRMTLHEYSGLATSSALDQTAGDSALVSSATADSGSTSTTTVADELLFGAGIHGAGGTLSAGTGYGNLTASPSAAGSHKQAGEDQIVSSTGAYNATMGLAANSSWIMTIATFKIASTTRRTWLIQ